MSNYSELTRRCSESAEDCSAHSRSGRSIRCFERIPERRDSDAALISDFHSRAGRPYSGRMVLLVKKDLRLSADLWIRNDLLQSKA